MKYITLIINVIILVGKLAAQAPQGINYQAVARNTDTSPKPNTTLTIGIKIKDALGADLYTESHTATTNGLGLFNLTIGQGSNPSTPFANISWATGSKLLEVIINGQSGGTQPLLSVPYALYAEKTNLQAGTGISVSGNIISNAGDLSNTNEIQTLSINPNNNQLSISGPGGNTVTLPTPPVYVPEIAIFEERYPTGTSAPISTNVNNYFTRQLNTTVLSSPNISLLSAGTENARLTLQAGTYLVEASAPCYVCGNNKIFLREIGSNAVKLTGSNGFSNTVDLQSTSFMNGVITVPQGQVLTVKLDHKISSIPVTNFLGKDNNVSGVNEVYSQIKIQKIQ